MKIIGDRIVPMSKQTFLKAIGIPKNPKGFNVQAPMNEDFQIVLNKLGILKILS